MHHSTYLACFLFFQILHSLLPADNVTRPLVDRYEYKILDVGSLDIDGNNRDCIQISDFGRYRRYKYFGLHTGDGPNVDVVYEDDVTGWPFRDAQFDIVISSSFLAQEGTFWVTFLNMVRAVKDGGFMFVCLPAQRDLFQPQSDAAWFSPTMANVLKRWADSQNVHGVNVLHASVLSYEVVDAAQFTAFADVNMIFWKSAIIDRCCHISDIAGGTTVDVTATADQLSLEFVYFRADLLTLLSNFALITNALNIIEWKMNHSEHSEPLHRGHRNSFVGIQRFQNRCIFSFPVSGARLPQSLIGSIPALEESALDTQGREIEFYHDLAAYFGRSYGYRRNLHRFITLYANPFAALSDDERLFVMKFQFSPPNGRLHDIYIPAGWIEPYRNATNHEIKGPLRRFYNLLLQILGSDDDAKLKLTTRLLHMLETSQYPSLIHNTGG